MRTGEADAPGAVTQRLLVPRKSATDGGGDADRCWGRGGVGAPVETVREGEGATLAANQDVLCRRWSSPSNAFAGEGARQL